jgi:hypothetical protein
MAKSLLTPSGVHAFHRLPGIPAVDPADQEDPWDPPPEIREFRIQVLDASERFLPCTFLVDAPFHGLNFPIIPGSPPTFDLTGVPLFSAPSRSAPPGLVVVRTSLREYGRSAPAAWAMLEISYLSGGKNVVARGMADRHGELIALFAMPEGARRGFSASPPVPNRQIQYPATLRFFYEPLSPPEGIADYTHRLAQPVVDAFTEGSPQILRTDAVLSLGTENTLPALELAVP